MKLRICDRDKCNSARSELENDIQYYRDKLNQSHEEFLKSLCGDP